MFTPERAVDQTQAPAAGPASITKSRRSLAVSPRAALSACRPRQWLKNGLVLAAPLAALALDDASAVVKTAVALACLCAMSSAGYIVNDLLDLEADRRHPVKCARAIASGRLTPSAAKVLAGGLAVCSLTAASTVSLLLLASTAAYGLLTVSYSRWLKHSAIWDLPALAGCFVLRVLAGAAATQIYVSPWFLAATAAGATTVAAAKRESELRKHGPGARPVLAGYDLAWLARAGCFAMTVLVGTFTLWAASDASGAARIVRLLAAAPLAGAMVRLRMETRIGSADEPDRILVEDRVLLGCGVVAVGLTVVGLLLSR